MFVLFLLEMMWNAEIQILNEEMIVVVVIAIEAMQINPKKFRDFNGDSALPWQCSTI